MAWSIQIARVFGIPIRLHLTFLLLLGWLLSMAASNRTMLWVTLGLFTCVVLHELGHSVVAQRFGVEVLDITLFPIGGIARMASIPRVPLQELLIAAAGPAVNFVLFPLFLLAHQLAGGVWVSGDIWAVAGAPLQKLAWLNLGLGLFNLLPAFPMDGGRILRAALALRTSYVRATQFASRLGQLVAFGMGLWGLLAPNPLVVFIAFFIFIGAAEEGARVQTQAITEGVAVKEAMITRFFTLTRADTLGKAADLLLNSTQLDFPIVEGEREEVVGVLTRARLIKALEEAGRDAYVGEAMDPAPPAVSPDAPLTEVLEQMAAAGQTLVPVHSAEGLCGLVTMDNTAEYVMVRAALLRAGEHRKAPSNVA